MAFAWLAVVFREINMAGLPRVLVIVLMHAQGSMQLLKLGTKPVAVPFPDAVLLLTGVLDMRVVFLF